MFCHFLDWPILTCFKLILSDYKRNSLKWALHPIWEHNERGEENFQVSQALVDNFKSSERICYSSWNDTEIIHQDYGGSSPGFVALQWVKIELFRRVNVTVGRWFHGGCCCQSEKAMAPHASTLAWQIPWTEEPGRLQSMGSRRVGHNWATSLSLFTFMHWRRKWQPTPVFLPGESQRWGSLVGCRLWGHIESDTTEAT